MQYALYLQHNGDTTMPTPETNWSTDPRVRPIMQSIRRNPPAVKQYAHGLHSAWVGGLVADQSEYDRDDERVIALNAICNEHFKRLDPIEAEQGYDAYIAAARAFGPDVATVIGYAIADRIAVAA
jgi:hypothetical protein